MRVIRCPHCGEPIPWIAHYCASCGLALPLEEASYNDDDATIPFKKPAHRERPRTLRVPSFYAVRDEQEKTLLSDNGQPILLAQVSQGNAPTLFSPLAENDRIAQQRIDEWLSEAEFGDEFNRRATWQKFVTNPTYSIARPSAFSGARPVAPITPAPIPSSLPLTPVTPVMPVTPVAQARPPFVIAPTQKRQPWRPPIVPRITSWITALVIVALVLGGAFGIFVSRGRGAIQPPASPMSLEVAPASIALGGVISLSGSHFTPNGRVGLTRDTGFPLIDTDGQSTIHSDATGAFHDTVSIDGSWSAGQHTIRAEDARLHKFASFTLQVTGHGISLLPSHLVLSSQSIDFGPGDQATNSAQTITLLNTGGGQISWQTTVTQPWLMLSPNSGTFSGGQQMQVTLATDRSSLLVGSYHAQVIFTSNAGVIPLAIAMQVTPLKPGHEAVLQVTPAVLSFSGVDGSANPTAQVVTISNPGVQPLRWNASAATSDGSDWLATSPASGEVSKGGSQPVSITINSAMLLPGVYYGSVTIASQGTEAVMNSPQTIYISVTIQPQCALQISPGALTLTAVYLRSVAATKAISVGTTQGCAAPLDWSAAISTNNGGHWLTLSATSGATPANPKVGIVVAGLLPGTYSGQLLFGTSAGTQTIPVTLIMVRATTPVLASSVAVLGVSGISGQPAPNPQTIVLSNAGGGSLSWSASVSTAVGGAWLSVSPPTGVLSAQQTTNLSIKAAILPALTPGTYNGTITLTGKDSSGHTVAGSPQTIAVTFTVQAPCSIAPSAPTLTFQGAVGQPAPAAQSITISASGACANALNWTATSATTPAGSTWLTITPASGTITPKLAAPTFVSVSLTGLVAGTYNGSIMISAVDSVTLLPVGKPQVVTITLTMQPACTLQAPSLTSAAFSSEAGLNPATQIFTIGVIGACTGNVTITPTATTLSGGAWLAISPVSAVIASNSTATFTVTVTSSALAAAPYSGAISLAGVESGGIAIIGNPQSVGVSLNVLSPPALAAIPATLSFSLATGSSSQSVTLNNTGGEPLNWTAALSGAPSYVSISSAASGTLLAGATIPVTITVNATGVAGGTTATASLSISATDPLTGNTITGSPATTSISIAVSPPAMQLNTSALAFSTSAGTNPAAQTISITNSGGDGLTWGAGTPSQTWLAVSPGNGSDSSGVSSPLTFTVNVAGMTAGSYSATVLITPSSGAAQTVTVNLTII